MWDTEETEVAFKHLPYYRTIVKSFMKKQIQLLLEEMCREAGEESVIMTVNLLNRTMSHLGSEVGKAFLDDRKDLKAQFLSYCISSVIQSTSGNHTGHHDIDTSKRKQPGIANEEVSFQTKRRKNPPNKSSIRTLEVWQPNIHS